MNFLTLAMILFFTPLVQAQKPCANNVEFAKKYSKNLPAGAEVLLNRVTDCAHLEDEPSESAERTEALTKSVDDSKCDQIEKDKESFLKKNQKNLEEIKKIYKLADQWWGAACD